jgi:hypothetical protein
MPPGHMSKCCHLLLFFGCLLCSGGASLSGLGAGVSGVEVHFFEQVDIEAVGVWIEDHVLPILVHQRRVGALVTEGHEVVAMVARFLELFMRRCILLLDFLQESDALDVINTKGWRLELNQRHMLIFWKGVVTTLHVMARPE